MRVTAPEAPASPERRETARRSFDASMDRLGRSARRTCEVEQAAHGSAGEAVARPAHGEPPPGAATPGGAALPELRVAARAIPPIIWAGRLAGSAAVELSFGRELRIELREGTGGVEIEVRVCPALARAARADLPALVRTLRERGVTVARAGVRGGPQSDGGAGAGEGPAVDARAPLR